MSESAETLPGDSPDRFLEALRAAEELEKLGFELNALRDDQIEELSGKFALSPEQRQWLRVSLKMGLPPA